MIEQLCAHLHNYFTSDSDRHAGRWAVENGGLDLPFLVPGQYFRICGSTFNDGVYQYPAQELADETFSGVIWPMKVPRAFLALADEIQAWVDKYGDVMNSPYQSESVIGEYSYTKASAGLSSGGDTQSDWQYVFRKRLNEWRKIA